MNNWYKGGFCFLLLLVLTSACRTSFREKKDLTSEGYQWSEYSAETKEARFYGFMDGKQCLRNKLLAIIHADMQQIASRATIESTEHMQTTLKRYMDYLLNVPDAVAEVGLYSPAAIERIVGELDNLYALYDNRNISFEYSFDLIIEKVLGRVNNEEYGIRLDYIRRIGDSDAGLPGKSKY